VAASQLDMTLLVVMVHGDHWDVFLGFFLKKILGDGEPNVGNQPT